VLHHRILPPRRRGRPCVCPDISDIPTLGADPHVCPVKREGNHKGCPLRGLDAQGKSVTRRGRPPCLLLTNDHRKWGNHKGCPHRGVGGYGGNRVTWGIWGNHKGCPYVGLNARGIGNPVGAEPRVCPTGLRGNHEGLPRFCIFRTPYEDSCKCGKQVLSGAACDFQSPGQRMKPFVKHFLWQLSDSGEQALDKRHIVVRDKQQCRHP
jgi:hypothetical protein